MGNSTYQQFLFSKVKMLTMVNGLVTFGAAGAVSSTSGVGVYAFTLLGTGLYSLQLKENFNAFIDFHAVMESTISGANVADGAFVIGTAYQITAVGTTNWHAIGLNASLTPAIGQQFVATGIGGAGTGTAKVVTLSGVSTIEIANPSASLVGTLPGQGAVFLVETLDAAGALVAPVSGSVMALEVILRNSSVAI